MNVAVIEKITRMIAAQYKVTIKIQPIKNLKKIFKS